MKIARPTLRKFISIFILGSLITGNVDAQRNSELPRTHEHLNQPGRQEPRAVRPRSTGVASHRYPSDQQTIHQNAASLQGGRFPRSQPTPVRPRYQGAVRYHDYRGAPVYSAHNPSWRYGYLPRRNAVVSVFPFSYQTIQFGGCGYRYYDGVFYRPRNDAYIVVAPPFGIFIGTLPFGYQRFVVRNMPYYYYNGTYYNEYQNQYKVVEPPVGAVVESIPPGYETLTINGETYYKVDNVQYKPVVQDNGEIWYEVIKSF